MSSPPLAGANSISQNGALSGGGKPTNLEKKILNAIMNPANPSNNYHYNKSLQKFARANRFNMTKVEACLWKYVLQNRQLAGYQFRRQRPILNYIVDFVCLELRLVIEVDGYSHEFEGKELSDRMRDEDLENVGFAVLRFTDSEILKMLPDVVERLNAWVLRDHDFPPPAPCGLPPASGGDCAAATSLENIQSRCF